MDEQGVLTKRQQKLCKNYLSTSGQCDTQCQRRLRPPSWAPPREKNPLSDLDRIIHSSLLPSSKTKLQSSIKCKTGMV